MKKVLIIVFIIFGISFFFLTLKNINHLQIVYNNIHPAIETNPYNRRPSKTLTVDNFGSGSHPYATIQFIGFMPQPGTFELYENNKKIISVEKPEENSPLQATLFDARLSPINTTSICNSRSIKNVWQTTDCIVRDPIGDDIDFIITVKAGGANFWDESGNTLYGNKNAYQINLYKNINKDNLKIGSIPFIPTNIPWKISVKENNQEYKVLNNIQVYGKSPYLRSSKI